MISVLTKRKNLGEHHVKMKAEMGVIHQQAKECLRFPENHQKLAEKQETHSPTPSLEGTNSTYTLILVFCPLERWDNKPPSVWGFVSTAPEKENSKVSIFIIIFKLYINVVWTSLNSYFH